MRAHACTAAAVLLFGAACAACTAPTVALQSPQTLAPKHVSATAGVSSPISTAFVGELVDSVQAAGNRIKDEQQGELTAAEERQIIEAVLAAVMLAPSVSVTADLRIGIVRGFDLGVRYGGPTIGLDGKLQLLDRRWDLALALGARHHTGLGPSYAADIYGVVERVRLVDYGREDLRTTLLYGTDDRKVVGFYGASFYELSFARLDIAFGLANEPADSDTSALLHTLGSAWGLRIGNRYIGLMLELALSYMIAEPQILGRDVSLSGFFVEPALGLRASY